MKSSSQGKPQKKDVVLIALGGNAIILPGEKGAFDQQMKNISECCKWLAPIAKENTMLITHGNGPQVGNMLLQQEAAKELVPPMPLDACSSNTQGFIGYMFQQCLTNEFIKQGVDSSVICMLTTVEVDGNDPAFQNYTKPVGGFYTKEEAEAHAKNKGWVMTEDSGRGYRRVVASPIPRKIVEHKAITEMLEGGYTVIACGGGGIPVKRNADNTYSGVEAVIDKDLTTALVSITVKPDIMVFITEVENVFINFGKPNAQKLDRVTVSEMEKYIKEGQFGKGSMEPKIIGAVDFIKKTGGEAIVCSLKTVAQAIQGKSGTRIVAG